MLGRDAQATFKIYLSDEVEVFIYRSIHLEHSLMMLGFRARAAEDRGDDEAMLRVAVADAAARSAVAERARRRVRTEAVGQGVDAVLVRLHDEAQAPVHVVAEGLVVQADSLSRGEHL